jgi:hypothetical protein
MIGGSEERSAGAAEAPEGAARKRPAAARAPAGDRVTPFVVLGAGGA